MDKARLSFIRSATAMGMTSAKARQLASDLGLTGKRASKSADQVNSLRGQIRALKSKIR